MTVLLDANVLIALVVGDHVHHWAAQRWLADSGDRFASCPITEGSLVRLMIRLATFDRGLAQLHGDITELISTEPPPPAPRPRLHD